MKFALTRLLPLWLALLVGACSPYGNPYTAAPNGYHCDQPDIGSSLNLQANNQLATNGQAELSLWTASVRILKQGWWSRTAPHQIELAFTQESQYQRLNDTGAQFEQHPSLTLSIQVSVTTHALYFEDGWELEGLEVVSSTDPAGCLQPGYILLRNLPF